MRLLILTMLMSSLPAFAGSFSCGESGLNDLKQTKAYTFLQSLPAKFQIGPCFVELHICDSTKPLEPGSMIGDIAVTDRYGQQFYVAFDFSNVQTEHVSKVILNGRRMMHYEFIERLPDLQNGRTEAYRLEILMSEDLSVVESVELGVYTSRLRGEYPRLKPGKSYWAICRR